MKRENITRVRWPVALLLALTALTVPSGASASHTSTDGTTAFNLLGVNTAVDPDSGFTFEVTGAGAIYEAGDVATGGGRFAHRDETGALLGHGTWAATALIDFESFAGPTPRSLGGVITIEVTLSEADGDTKPGVVMTITCLAGVTFPDYDVSIGGSTLCHDANDDLG